MLSWLSIAPHQFYVYETWLVRAFLFLGIVTIGPWVVFLFYDLVLFAWHVATYDIPYLGGRAKGRARLRAPSLTERPDGRPRTLHYSSPSRSSEKQPTFTSSSRHPRQDSDVRKRSEVAIEDD